MLVHRFVRIDALCFFEKLRISACRWLCGTFSHKQQTKRT